MSILYIILAAIALLAPLIIIHEFGHYWTARLFGVKVLVYSIGFGPKLLKWQSKKTGIIYQLSAIPLGGYVRMLDEREFAEKGLQLPEHEQKQAFNRQAVWKRFLIVFAGPAINLLFAIVLFWILFLPQQEQLNTRIGKVLSDTVAATQLQQGDKIIAVDNKPVHTWQDIHWALVNRVGETGHIQLQIEREQTSQQVSLKIEQFLNEQQSPLEYLGFLPYQPTIKPVINQVVAGSAADLQGLKVGDEIVKINDKPVQDWYDVVRIVRKSPEILLKIDVLREQTMLSLKVMPQAKYDNGQRYGSLGVSNRSETIVIPDDYKQIIQYSPLEALQQAVLKTVQTSQMIVGSVVKMIAGLIGLDQLSGPISVAKVAGQTAELGWQSFIGFMALMSVSLAILNLLPIPMLDGGHLVYYMIEAIKGSPVSEQIQLLGFKIGVLLLGCLTFLALFNDLMRL